MDVEIKELEALLSRKFSKTTVKKYTSKPLVEPGENYASLLYSVTLQLDGPVRGSTELHLVAKTVPKSETIKKYFNISQTFKREIDMYEIIIPTLRDFQIEQIGREILCPPDVYATRASLNSESDAIDDDAIILMENLKCSGFTTFDRVKGFDYDTARAAITNLAIFHAVPVALKIIKPDMFKNRVLPHLKNLDIFMSVSEDIRKSKTDRIIKITKLKKECVSLIPNIVNAFETYDLHFRNQRVVPKEPFATIVHNDFWVNNIMIKHVDNKPVDCKIIDFQTIEYGPASYDVVFFLYSSLQEDVLEKRIYDLINDYFESFVRTLKSFKCDTTAFRHELFMQEIEEAAKVLFMRIMVRLDFILSPKGVGRSIEKMIEENLATDRVTKEYQDRFHKVILDYYQKGWI